MLSDPISVAVIGPYGTGKSSVVEEIAGMLEEAELSYAALDLDWLWWFDADGIDDDAYTEMLIANLSAVVRNYRDAGVERFVMAWAVKDAVDLGILRKTLSMPLHVVRLTVALEVIRARLAPLATTDGNESWVLPNAGWPKRSGLASAISKSTTSGPFVTWRLRSSTGSIGCNQVQRIPV